MTSSAAATDAATTGGELPTAYMIGGKAADARTDASETYRVIQTVTAKIVSASAAAMGLNAKKTPHEVATPFPPESEPHGIDVAHNSRQPRAGNGGARSRQPLGENDTRGTLRHVKQSHEETGRHSRRPHDIGRADIAAPDSPEIDRAPPPRDDERERDGANEVPDEHCGNHVSALREVSGLHELTARATSTAACS